MVRRHHSSGSSFESSWGYSRAVIDGDHLWLSGTTGYDYATMTLPDGAEAQARAALRTIRAVLEAEGFTLADVVRVRYFVASREEWAAVGLVAGEVFGAIRPAATALVTALIEPAMRVEIEVDAVRRGSGGGG